MRLLSAALLAFLCVAQPAMGESLTGPMDMPGEAAGGLSLPPTAKPLSETSSEEDKKVDAAAEVEYAISQANEEYDAAFKKLAPEQQAKLQELEDAYTKETLEINATLVNTGFEFKHCAGGDAEFAKNLPHYQSAMGVYRNGLLAELMPMRDRHRARRRLEAAFIDQNLLERRYNLITSLAIAKESGARESAMAAGEFEKTDCKALQEKLDGALQKAGGHRSTAGAVPPEKLKQVLDGVRRGDPEATIALAMMHLAGSGVQKDPDKGIRMLTALAEKGNDRAQYMLGLALGTDLLGQKPDKEKAKYWLQQSAGQGNKKAAQMLEVLAHEKPPEPLEEVRRKAEAGDMNAEHDLAIRYAYGLGGLERDAAEALKWELRAAGKGHPLAQSDLAIMLLNDNKPQDALVWMTKAAENGVVNSQYQLGTLYFKGLHVPKDEEKAVYWLRKAGAGGDSRAIQLLEQIELQKMKK